MASSFAKTHLVGRRNIWIIIGRVRLLFNFATEFDTISMGSLTMNLVSVVVNLNRKFKTTLTVAVYGFKIVIDLMRTNEPIYICPLQEAQIFPIRRNSKSKYNLTLFEQVSLSKINYLYIESDT